MSSIYSTYYHEPNPRFGECGAAFITTDIDTTSSEQLDKFNETCKRILKSLNNLVSSYSDTSICPINEGKKSSLTFSIYLAGNPYQEEGQYEVRAMSNKEIIIVKEIKKE
jgi:hypothetical protein